MTRAHIALKERLGPDIYKSWFRDMRFIACDGGKTILAQVPHKFVGIWIRAHYHDQLRMCVRAEFRGVKKIIVQHSTKVRATSYDE